MSNLLSKIVANKITEVNQRKKANPLANFIKEVVKSSKSLKDSLSNEHSDFILECKKASPSKGLLRDSFDDDLDYILKQYSDYASAISVVTDQKFFQGNFSYLSKASNRVKCPVLCKDFFIDEYQIYEARFYGADAILLMLSVLNDNEYKKLATAANKLDLDILTEVHDERELQRALALDAEIIGINNRNLRDLSIDLATTEKLTKLIPDNNIVISESGISSRSDVKRLSSHVQGFLIGSSIMKKTDIRTQCKKLLFGNIKICGITRIEDAVEVDKQGATHAGFIFHKLSKRYIDIETAETICTQVPLNYVGVFVNEKIEEVIESANRLNLYAVQLHGEESDDYIAELREKLPSINIWKAIPVSNSVVFNKKTQVDRYLLDTYSVDEKGGTGRAFNWNLITSTKKDDIILAGGINTSNVIEALSKDTYALDLSSGVETQPGIKCSKKLEMLFNQLRA